MKVAIVGTGVAGNVAAYKLRQDHDVTVFESAAYVGGHTNTVDVYEDGQRIGIDTGFIVFNDRTYPRFINLLEEVGQNYQATEMSFSVRSETADLEYSGSSLNTLFAQRRNLLRPSFHRMLRDILRFNEEAPADVAELANSQTLEEYLAANRYGREFTEHYLVPMVAAIWSAEPGAALQMPVAFLVRFFANHGLLQLSNRPVWRVISGGSREYVSKLVAGHRDRIRLNCAVRSIRRIDDRIELVSETGGRELFDFVFLACHSDQALALLKDPTKEEIGVLGAMRYQSNEAVLHTDASLMPKRRRAWAAWNYHLPSEAGGQVAVTYNMNILQGLRTRKSYCVTLNSDQCIDPATIIKRVQYQHPMFSRESVAAQGRQSEINSDRTFYCGAYWGNGFHEDGVVSTYAALKQFERRLLDGKLHLRRAG